MELGKFENKHGVAIIVNSKCGQKVTWVECVSERVTAASISVSKPPITLISTYMPHSRYTDHQIEETYAIRSVVGIDKSMKIRLEVRKQVSVITHSKKQTAKGEWMDQLLLEQKLVSLKRCTKHFSKASDTQNPTKV